MNHESNRVPGSVRVGVLMMARRPQPMLWCCVALLALIVATGSPARSVSSSIAYGDRIARLSKPLSRLLAEKDKPNSAGAMGRNRRAYFHVRFQLGLHNLAHYGIAAKDERALAAFVSAVEYAFDFQNEAGDFRVVLPPELEGQALPGRTDLASGTAFFAASLGSALLAWETSSWVQSTPSLSDLCHDLAVLSSPLDRLLDYLLASQERLMVADQKAPNRLLMTAVALHSLGLLLDNDEALERARDFVDLSLVQLSPEGYFIEGGGYDSSYNGVATSLGLRLLMMGYQDEALVNATANALQWQRQRILANGEISTEGNARVKPDAGETFLGRKKDVDVGQTIEALLMASIYFDDPSNLEIAKSIVRFYRRKSR